MPSTLEELKEAVDALELMPVAHVDAEFIQRLRDAAAKLIALAERVSHG